MITCTFEDGGAGKLRHITVGVLLLDKGQNKILLVKRSSTSFLEPNKFDIPGGFMSRSETTKETATREVKEETGYEIKITGLFCLNDNPDRPKEDRQNVEFIYIAEAVNEVTIPDSEVSYIKWFPLESLPSAEDFAFDHYQVIKKFLSYKKQSFPLPIFLDTYE
jgi:8-oxo-dGTP diphosphatase